MTDPYRDAKKLSPHLQHMLGAIIDYSCDVLGVDEKSPRRPIIAILLNTDGVLQYASNGDRLQMTALLRDMNTRMERTRQVTNIPAMFNPALDTRLKQPDITPQEMLQTAFDACRMYGAGGIKSDEETRLTQPILDWVTKQCS